MALVNEVDNFGKIMQGKGRAFPIKKISSSIGYDI